MCGILLIAHNDTVRHKLLSPNYGGGNGRSKRFWFFQSDKKKEVRDLVLSLGKIKLEALYKSKGNHSQQNPRLMLSIPGGSHDEDGVKSDPKLQSSLGSQLTQVPMSRWVRIGFLKLAGLDERTMGRAVPWDFRLALPIACEPKMRGSIKSKEGLDSAWWDKTTLRRFCLTLMCAFLSGFKDGEKTQPFSAGPSSSAGTFMPTWCHSISGYSFPVYPAPVLAQESEKNSLFL